MLVADQHKSSWAISRKWYIPKIRGTIWGVPTIRTIIFWGLYWGPLILGNYQIKQLEDGELYWAIRESYRDCSKGSIPPVSTKHQG